MRIATRSLSAVGAAAVVWVLTSGTALAADGVVYDGDDPGPGFTPLETLGIFVGIPLAVLFVVILGVYGPSWARGRDADVASPQEPVWMSSPAGAMSPPKGPGMLPAGPTDHTERGGASARW